MRSALRLTSRCCAQALEAGALPALVALLHSGSIACQTGAARALAPLVVNDSNKGAAMRDGVALLLTRMLDSGVEGVQVGAALAIAGFAANSEDCQVRALPCDTACACKNAAAAWSSQL